jgi:MarR-like DNA-binding transcriptional regulator SgrR of sgrS sRNA
MSKLANKSIQIGAQNIEDDLEMDAFLEGEMKRIDSQKTYFVWLRSVPGFHAQYDGKVEVRASDEDDAVQKAFRKLKMGAFPDRDRSMWKIEKVERKF